ncbi:MAG: 6-pyruvoyl tetrahydrobiopterin synthase [Pirellula sp.]|nr:6-pyruvoyl tetrahydrobiopterin synthase [Pirellula sp.]
MSQESYSVRLRKTELVFSAAHFITFAGNICERLHGHNYRTAVEVFGPLDENEYVVDFIALRDTLKKIVLELDHHMLLPTRHPQIRVEADEREVVVRFEERRWVFPRQDCVLLPLVQTTAELLAKHIADTLLERLAELSGYRPRRLRVIVDECEGQEGVYERVL